MSKPILERAVGVIQRDRLSKFVKESHLLDGGCFHYALISCFNYLYPNKLLSRTVEEKIEQGLKMGGGGVAFGDVIGEVKRFQSELGLKVDHIVNHTDKTIEDVKKGIPKHDWIPVVDSKDGKIYPNPGISTAITLLERKDGSGGHFFALVENPRFQDNGGIMGGNTEYQKIKDRYVSVVSFIIVKSEG